MSTFTIANAAAAYARNAQKAPVGGMEPRSGDPAQNFSDMVGDALKTAVDSGSTAENMSARALVGKADLTDVVTAVKNAEVTLQTVIAVRDKVVAAYQEIARMPI
jgi:flagellar hook-basal body complex protein FliE